MSVPRDPDCTCPPYDTDVDCASHGSNTIVDLRAEVERLRGRCERFCTICKGHYFHRDPLCPWCEISRLRDEWVPDAAYAKVYDERDTAVRLLREVVGAWDTSSDIHDSRLLKLMDAAEKYLEELTP